MLRRRGFTLIEVLVAAGLIGLVMGMAMQAFMGMGKLSDQAKSRLVAGSEASKGLREVAALLRRAHVIYYTGRPIQPGTRLNTNADIVAGVGQNLNGDYSNDPPTVAIPNILGGLGPMRGPNLLYNFQDPTAPLPANLATGGSWVDVRRGAFRFWDWGGDAQAGNTLTGAPNSVANNLRRLGTSQTPIPANVFDRWFSSPLLYIGEVDFAMDRNNAGNTDGTIENMFRPLSWTFHVIYLAPMDVRSVSTPSWITNRRAQDMADEGWRRSTIPFELRVLTIPNVDVSTEGQRYVAQRGIPLGGPIRNTPHEYAPFQVNYDPYPVVTQVNAANRFDTALGSAFMGNPPSGWRVNGALHTNFNNIGNDPPNQAALSIRVGPPATPAGTPALPLRDKVLCQYIDPDSVHGTCIRLLNTIGTSNGNDTLNAETAHAVAGGRTYRRYLNAYGDDFMYDHYFSVLAPALRGNWGLGLGSGIPSRALISISTRYRTSSQIKFQFAQESMELDLENVTRFQNLRRRPL